MFTATKEQTASKSILYLIPFYWLIYRNINIYVVPQPHQCQNMILTPLWMKQRPPLQSCWSLHSLVVRQSGNFFPSPCLISFFFKSAMTCVIPYFQIMKRKNYNKTKKATIIPLPQGTIVVEKDTEQVSLKNKFWNWWWLHCGPKDSKIYIL